MVALAVSGALLVGRGQEVDPEKATPTSVVGDRVDTDGGTLNALTLGPVVTWDPQRIASRDDMAFAPLSPSRMNVSPSRAFLSWRIRSSRRSAPTPAGSRVVSPYSSPTTA